MSTKIMAGNWGKPESKAVDDFRRRIRKAIADDIVLAHWGDGNAGWMIKEFYEALEDFGVYKECRSPKPKKKKIPNRLRTAVFERDAYRCRVCESHIALSADHIIPESKGGPTTFSNLQTLCHSCNSRKGAR